MLIVRNSLSLARAAAAADAGVQRGLLDAFRNDNAPDLWRRDGQSHAWTFDGVPVRVEMRDESAKIDVNTASDPLLRGLFLSVGVPEDEVTKLLDAILDWRDPDTLKRPNGAEEDDYRAAGLSYRPSNSAFQAIEEIQLVLGMRPDIYRRIAPMITVFSRQTGVNAMFATREVLLAIPGVTPEIVDEYIQRRADALAAGQPPPVFAQGAAYAGGSAMITNVRAEARLEDGTYFAREAVALLRSTPRKPVTFVVWRESTAPPESKPPQEAAHGWPASPKLPQAVPCPPGGRSSPRSGAGGSARSPSSCPSASRASEAQAASRSSR
jgi:general secretion pathway protein K